MEWLSNLDWCGGRVEEEEEEEEEGINECHLSCACPLSDHKKNSSQLPSARHPNYNALAVDVMFIC